MEIIFAAVVTVLVQLVKQKLTNQWQTLGLVLVLSLGAAGFYVALVNAGLWESFVQILAYAGAIYTFILQRFEEKPQTAPQLWHHVKRP